eukprot:ctg_1091.g341
MVGCASGAGCCLAGACWVAGRPGTGRDMFRELGASVGVGSGGSEAVVLSGGHHPTGDAVGGGAGQVALGRHGAHRSGAADCGGSRGDRVRRWTESGYGSSDRVYPRRGGRPGT